MAVIIDCYRPTTETEFVKYDC